MTLAAAAKYPCRHKVSPVGREGGLGRKVSPVGREGGLGRKVSPVDHSYMACFPWG